MMTSIDTLQTAKRLREAGFAEGQAEALTGVLRDVQAGEQSRLATKADIGALDAKIDRVAGELRAEFALIRSEMEVLCRDLTIRLGSMIVVATGVLLAAKFFS